MYKAYKGTSIKLLADFLTKTLQVRREWHYILKVMTEKLTTKNTLPSKALIQIWWGNKKLEELSTTSVTKNAKETFIGGKEKASTRNKKIMT